MRITCTVYLTYRIYFSFSSVVVATYTVTTTNITYSDIKNGTTEGTASGDLTAGMQSYYKSVDIKTSGLPYGMLYRNLSLYTISFQCITSS